MSLRSSPSSATAPVSFFADEVLDLGGSISAGPRKYTLHKKMNQSILGEKALMQTLRSGYLEPDRCMAVLRYKDVDEDFEEAYKSTSLCTPVSLGNDPRSLLMTAAKSLFIMAMQFIREIEKHGKPYEEYVRKKIEQTVGRPDQANQYHDIQGWVMFKNEDDKDLSFEVSLDGGILDIFYFRLGSLLVRVDKNNYSTEKENHGKSSENFYLQMVQNEKKIIYKKNRRIDPARDKADMTKGWIEASPLVDVVAKLQRGEDHKPWMGSIKYDIIFPYGNEIEGSKGRAKIYFTSSTSRAGATSTYQQKYATFGTTLSDTIFPNTRNPARVYFEHEERERRKLADTASIK